MQVPFEGFVVPPTLYTACLVVGTLAVVAILSQLRPPVTELVAVAFAPWMVSGAALHVFYQLGEIYGRQVYSPLVEPFFSAPAVYLTTFLLMGVVWIAAVFFHRITKTDADRTDYVARYLGTTGAGIMIVLIGLTVWQGLDPLVGPMDPIFPTIGLLVSLAVTFVVYLLVGLWRTYVVAEMRYVGAFVLFAHVFDGVTTAIGVDIIGTGERSVLPARIMDFAAGLPTAPYLGSGWLFILVKILVAVFVVVVFADFVREEPTRGNLLLAVIAAVGLGPGANNFLLFLLGAG